MADGTLFINNEKTDITGKLDVSNDVTFSSLAKQSSLIFTDGNGKLENDTNFTYDGTHVKIDPGKKALDVIGNIEITEINNYPSLNKDDGILPTDNNGKLENDTNFTYDGNRENRPR